MCNLFKFGWIPTYTYDSAILPILLTKHQSFRDLTIKENVEKFPVSCSPVHNNAIKYGFGAIGAALSGAVKISSCSRSSAVVLHHSDAHYPRVSGAWGADQSITGGGGGGGGGGGAGEER